MRNIFSDILSEAEGSRFPNSISPSNLRNEKTQISLGKKAMKTVPSQYPWDHRTSYKGPKYSAVLLLRAIEWKMPGGICPISVQKSFAK